MAEVASAYVTLLPSAKGFGRKLDAGISSDVSRSGGVAGKGFGAAFGKAFVAIGAGLGVARFLGDSLAEAREAQKVGALTRNVIKTTGGAAKVSAKQVEGLSTAISNKTGIDDEAIQSGANLLLTFKNVKNELGSGNKIFDRATQAAADLSASGFGDLAGTSKQLGKALNDPVKGISALGRAGVTFTDQQKAQIKTFVKSGKTLKAQRIILGEVESQVGGAAAAQATAGDKFKVAFGNLKESIGTALLPLLDKVATFLTEKVIPALYDLEPVFKKVKKFVQPAIDAIRGISDGTGKTSERVKQFKDTLSSSFDALKSIFESTVSIIKSLWNTFGETLKSSLDRNLTSILNIVKGAFNILAGLFKIVASLLKGDWSGVWEGIKQVTSGALTFIKGIIQGGVNTIKTTFGLLKDALKGVMSEAFQGVKNAARNGISGVAQFLETFPEKIKTAVGDLSSVLYDAGVDLIKGLLSGIGSKFGDVKDKLGELTGKLPGWKGPPKRDKIILKPAGRLLIDGLISGISDGTPALEKHLGGLTGAIPRMSLGGVSGGASGRSTGGGGTYVLRVGDREFSAYMEEVADSRVGAARSLDGMTGRAFG